jgi:hypothetical protein
MIENIDILFLIQLILLVFISFHNSVIIYAKLPQRRPKADNIQGTVPEH